MRNVASLWPKFIRTTPNGNILFYLWEIFQNLSSGFGTRLLSIEPQQW
jgi:hypothetical protein